MTISDEYRRLNQSLHDTNTGYGAFGHRWVDPVAKLVQVEGLTSVLDYGCGKGTLLAALGQRFGDGLRLSGYDPAMPVYAAAPQPAELVVCGDVLEHVEPEHLDAVLDDLARLTVRFAFLVVSVRPAQKTLPDGRNAHLIQQPYRWWLPKLWARWDIRRFQQSRFLEPDDEFVVIAARSV